MTILLFGRLGFNELLSYDAERGEQLYDPYGKEKSIYDYARTNLDSGTVYVERIRAFNVIYGNPNLIVTEGHIYPLGRAEIYDEPIPDYFMLGRKITSEQVITHRLETVYEWELIYEDETGQVYRRVP
jgi:hypothetical protein